MNHVVEKEKKTFAKIPYGSNGGKMKKGRQVSKREQEITSSVRSLERQQNYEDLLTAEKEEGQELRDTVFCSLQEEFHTVVSLYQTYFWRPMKSASEISPVKLHFGNFPPPERRPSS